MSKLIVLRGLPGSGKSTLANQMLSMSKDNGRSVAVVNNDSICKELFGVDFKPNSSWAVRNERVRRVIEASKTHDIVILDNTNLSKNAMGEARWLCKFWFDDGLIVSLLSVPLEECLANNKARERVVPEDVIISMSKNIFKPNLTSLFFEQVPLDSGPHLSLL